MRGALLVVPILVAAFTQWACAEDQLPAPAKVREAVARSLPVIEKASAAWRERRQCMSCHHVTFMLWSHNEAAAHGIVIDAKKHAEWNEWSMQRSLAERAFFKLSEKSVAALPGAPRHGLADIVNVPFT